jgi:hypothetical protein
MKAAGLFLSAATVAVLALSGCGGGGHSDDSQTTIHGNLSSGDNTLPTSAYVQSGSYVDVYSCTARRDGNAQVDMKSSDFDSFLIIGTEDSSGHIQTLTTDDNSGDGSNARAKFSVSQDVRYFVAATNADGSGRTGAYELDFSNNLKDVREEPQVTPAILAAAAHALQDYKAKQAAPAAP